MSPSTEEPPRVIPAEVGFLAIYNPSLGTNDETIQNQTVYYYSQESRRKSRDRSEDPSREQSNEQLRQIGLAQGMVEFSRNFSHGSAVDAVETEKSRIILHELEPGWWILASINLTVLPRSARSPTGQKYSEDQATVEYSSREVKPAVLLLGDLLQAHSTFLLHHASSMSALFVRTKRSKFIGLLTRYWDTHLSTWNVLMHGNPANNLYGGVKLAASGELGIGVGEEERGSGEREVLEGFVGRIDGLVDIMVSKFGNEQTGLERTAPSTPQSPWLGSGDEPEVDDGAIFLGTGALSRKSMRDISHWVQDLYRWGPHAYGVLDNPTSNRRAKKSTRKNRNQDRKLSPDTTEVGRGVYGLPQRGRSKGRHSLSNMEPMPVSEEDAHIKSKSKLRPSLHRGSASHNSTDSESTKTKKFVSYLKLGYGTHWTLGSTSTKEESESDLADPAGANKQSTKESGPNTHPTHETDQSFNDSAGHYLIGLMGDLEDEPSTDGADGRRDTDDEASKPDHNSRVLLRTLTVELEREEDARAETDISIDLGEVRSDISSSKNPGSERTGTSTVSFESQDRNKTKKLRVVVYVHRPFVFVFLFELRSDALAWTQLYRSLHRQLQPLHKPLLQSTQFRAALPDLPTTSDTNDITTPIYHLLWDPISLTVQSTIPNIPNPYLPPSPQASQPWSRIEALSTHLHLLSTFISTKTSDRTSLERTGKTSRGWWVVWLRIPSPIPTLAVEPPSTTSLTSGQVKVPTLITEDSMESKASAHIPAPTRPISSSGDEQPSSSPTGVSGRRDRTAKGPTSTMSNNTSIFSGPAHPFQEAVSPVGVRRSRDKEVWLVRKGGDGNGALGRLGMLKEVGEEKEGQMGRGIGLGDYGSFVEGLLGLR